MTRGMLVAVHSTSDIGFSNNHSTYVHLSTLSSSLITLITLRLVKDATTVELFKTHIHIYIYKTEKLSKILTYIILSISLYIEIQCFFSFFGIWNPSFTPIIVLWIFIIKDSRKRLVKGEWNKIKRRRLTVGPLPHYFIKG